MSRCRVQIQPRGTVFDAEPGETVLNAALRQGVPIRYGCRHGNCSTCKYLITDGDVDLGNASPYSLSEQEREQGFALLCCARPLSDLEIEIPEDQGDRLRPVIVPSENGAAVLSSEPVSRTLYRVRLRLDQPWQFYPGQFLELEVPGHVGEWRSYSMASAPSEPRELELVVQRIAGGLFSDRLGRLRAGESLRVRGPYGTSYLRDGDRPVLLIAGGSGIAPMLSILHALADGNDPRTVTFFYGARTAKDLPLQAEITALQRRIESFRYRPALSEPTPECGWSGPVGMIAQIIQGDVDDASPFDAYICGPPPMCDTVSLILAAKGLAEERTFLDRFYSAVTTH